MDLLSRIKAQWGELHESWRFAIPAFLIARTLYALWSLVILTVQPVAVHYVEVENQPAILFLDLHTNQTYTYLRTVQGNELTFRSASPDSVTDLQTGSTWNIRSGEAVAGFYDGQRLTSATFVSETMFSYFRASPYPDPLLALWQRFDANVYVTIAEYGYGQITEDTHFPPLYPASIHLLAFIVGNPFLAGLVISHICILYALKALHETFCKWGDPVSGRRALACLLLFPTSFFFFGAYSESLFLLTVLLSLRAMSTRAWHWAGFWTFCAILTRLTGVALIPPMLYLMWREGSFLRRPGHWIGPGVAGLAGLLYLYIRFSHLSQQGALPFSEPSWYARLVFPWESFLHAFQILFSGHANYIDLLNTVAAILLLILFLWAWKQIPLEYNLYSAFTLLILFSRIVETKAFNSMLRFSLTLFPLFFVLGLAGTRPLYQRIVSYTFICLNLFLSADFFSWGWVA